ncbi:methyltransferase [Helicobacter sp. 16-1353]|uniref:tRNA1(Val) (adenine(37)-N6)-methyltransferase n=1 Tax=Helicobacter sp. 16-1353 TaxID=2004996 RepID=UPI0015EFD90A|nr:methyltransferase [Helicobacter sp. 16-1353]
MDTKKLELYQLSNGYCYNSDSLFLYSFIRNFLKDNIKLLDIGTGCGILGLLCARDFKIDLTLNDINPLMTNIALKNAKHNNIICDVVNGDILESKLSGFDVIVSNPPFYRKDILDSKNNHLYLAKKSENLPLSKLVRFVKNALKPSGIFIFCYDAKEIKNVFHSLEINNFNIEVLRFVYPKENKNANLMMCQCKISKSQTKILPPLYNFIGSENTKEAKEIFKTCKTLSIKLDNLE